MRSLVVILISSVVMTPQNIDIPNSTDGELQTLREKVTEYKHRQCYQHMTTGKFPGIYPVEFLPGADRVGQKMKRSNAHEFPWRNTAGFEGTPRHYVWFPPDKYIEYSDSEGPRA